MNDGARRPRWLNDDEQRSPRSVPSMDEANALVDLAEQLVHVGRWRVRLPDNAISWSAEVYRIHGVTPDSYSPDIETAINFYHPDDREMVRQAFVTAARDGAPFEVAARLIRSDGELRHVKSRGVTLSGPDDEFCLICGIFVDVTDEQRAEELLREAILNLERMAYVDALTNIANRRQFDDTLEREWRRAMREQTPLSLILLDIDRFKLFNDHYGHPAGDDCLRRVAMAIGSAARRPSDLVARYGGEEFALILPVTDATGAEMVAQDARASIAALGLAHEGNAACGGVVTGSFGVATAIPQFCASPAARLDLIAEADGFLYEAKRTGRNRIVSLDTIVRAGVAPLAANEATRLAALEAYHAAGATRRTVEMDQIAQLAATLTTAPIGLVSFVGRDEQRFGGIFGLEGVGSTKRDVSFCAHTILGDEPFVVPDATRDVRFSANPLVTGEMGLRYYAGAPIISKTTGHRLGSVCIIDTTARTETSSAERALLTDLAKMAANLLEDNMQAARVPEVSKERAL